MSDEKCFCSKRLSIAPSILIGYVCRNLTSRETLAQGRELLHKLYGATGEAWRKGINRKRLSNPTLFPHHRQ